MSRNLSEDHPDKRAASTEFGVRQLFRRPAMPARKAVLHIKLFADSQVVTTSGDFTFAISEDMDLLSLVAIEAFVSTASSAGGLSVTIHNVTQAVDMAQVTIDANEFTSCTSADPTINAGTNTVDHCDLILVDTTSAGANAQGLGVMITFGPQAVP